MKQSYSILPFYLLFGQVIHIHNTDNHFPHNYVSFSHDHSLSFPYDLPSLRTPAFSAAALEQSQTSVAMQQERGEQHECHSGGWAEKGLGKAQHCLSLPKACRDGGGTISHTTCCQFSKEKKKGNLSEDMLVIWVYMYLTRNKKIGILQFCMT